MRQASILEADTLMGRKTRLKETVARLLWITWPRSANARTFGEALRDEGVPVPVLTAALYERFASRGEADCQDTLLSAMRLGFGGHLEQPEATQP